MERTQKQVRERVEAVRKKEELRRRVCKEKERGRRRGRRVEERRSRGHGQVGRLTDKWRVGRLTNQEVYVQFMQAHKTKNPEERTSDEKKWYEKHRKGREGWRRGRKGGQKLGRRVVVQLQTQGLRRKEACRCGVLTRGRVKEKESVGAEGGEAKERQQRNKRTYRRKNDRTERRLRRRRRHRKDKREGVA